MPALARSRLVNPRLGTYFGIFASAFAAVVLMGLLLGAASDLDLECLWPRLGVDS